VKIAFVKYTYMIKKIFDKIEIRLRGWLSHYPVFYGLVGGIGVVLFWRGVWHTVDYLMLLIAAQQTGQISTDLTSKIWWDGPLSLIIGFFGLIITGLFVSSFIGNEVIMSGLRGEKKLYEKTEGEVKTEVRAISDIRDEVLSISEKLERLINK